MMKSLDLSGTWLARWSDGCRGRKDFAARDTTERSRYIEAQVPGEIHLDLQRAGLIGDVHVGNNALGARWVEECFWSYRREFEAPAAALKAIAAVVHRGFTAKEAYELYCDLRK